LDFMNINPNPSRSLKNPFIRVKIGDDVFTTGDGLLASCSITLAEGSGATACQFTIHDPSRKFTNKYFTYIESVDGLDAIVVPKDSKSGTTTGTTFNGSIPASLKGFDQNRIKEAIAYYLAQGFSNLGTAAIIGSIAQESSFNPGGYATDQGTGTAASEGLLQWTYERKNGMPRDNYTGQLAFSLVEMQRDTPSAYTVLRDSSASESQVRTAMANWIRWGDVGSRWEYAAALLEAIEGNGSKNAERSVSKSSTPEKEATPKKKETPSGSQITVELGFDGKVISASSFIHTSLNFDLFAANKLVFGGQAVAWVLTQRKQNNAYSNVTFRQFAQRVTSSYGITLDMTEEGPTYTYFPLRGLTEYDALLIESRRLGFRIQSIGNTLKIGEREAKDPGFTLVYGENLGTKFTLSHTASTDSEGGARASDSASKTVTGQRKFSVDPATGEIKQLTPEASHGVGIAAKLGTTGNATALTTPIESTPDKTASSRKENEKRVKGFIANWSCPTSPEALLLDPDSVLRTSGISKFIDRVWVIESITHSWTGGKFETSGVSYTPLKNKKPKGTSSSSGSAIDLPPGCAGKVSQAAIDYKGMDTSAGPGSGREACVYAVNRVFEKAGLTPPWGTAEFVPTAETGLVSSGAKLVPAGQEKPGDIVIGDNGTNGHIGIVIGSDKVLSNSSSAAKYIWESELQMGGRYGEVRIYRLNC
jgi:Phage tail lysozyme